MNKVTLGNYTISEIKEPICPPYASEKTRKRFIAWNTWNGFGRRPSYPRAALKKDKLTAATAKAPTPAT